MQEKTDRNIELYKKKMDGATYRKLAIEYGLGEYRVFTLVKRVKNKIAKGEITL